MNRKEAIAELTHELRVWESECKSVHPMKDALKMAIEALSQPIVCTDFRIDPDYIYCAPETAQKVHDALHNTNVQHMPNVNLISRKEAIRELCEMMVDCFNADEEVIDAIKTTVEEIQSTDIRGEKE